jgi:acetyl esterase/lipase
MVTPISLRSPTAVAYRLAPETRFPGPLHDAVSTYFRMLEDLHIPPTNILFAGDSAGGGLCLALLMYLRDNGYPLPAGAILMSPWVGQSPVFLV